MLKVIKQAISELISPSKANKSEEKMDEEEEKLFRRPDGRPMIFTCTAISKERAKVMLTFDDYDSELTFSVQMRNQIEQRGGNLVQKTALSRHSERDHVIKLVPSTAQILIKDVDMFDEKFIQDCVDQNQLMDLNDYRTGQRPMFETYDANSIMKGFFGWKDLNRLEDGEKVSDIEDDDDMEESGPVKKKPVKAYAKMLYCKNEQQEIIDWIVKNEAYKSLKGNEIWKQMQEDNVGRGRTWQSLKEHFRKTLIGQIHTFGLSDEIQNNFKVAMGLKQGEIISPGGGTKPPEPPAANVENKKGVCSICGPRPVGIKRLSDLGYVCENCSRPSTSIFAQQTVDEDLVSESGSMSGNNPDLDKLLDDSHIELADLSDEITKGSIAKEEIPSFPKTNSPLTSQRLHNSSVDSFEPNSSLLDSKKKKNKGREIEDPSSPQDFAAGAGLTSTQDLGLGSDTEEETLSPRQSQRLKTKTKIDWSHVIIHPNRREKGRTDREEDTLDDNKHEKEQVEIFDNQEDEDEEYQPEEVQKPKISKKRKNTESPSPRKKNKSGRKSVSPKKKTPVKKKAKPRSESSTDEDILPRSSLDLPDVHPPGSPPKHSPSKDLLERHLEDQMTFQRDNERFQDQVDTENQTDRDGLDNIDQEEPVAAVTPTKQRLRHGLFETRSDKWETDTNKSGRFFNHGEFSANFRLPYSSSEERAMVDFFLNEGGYRIRKGRAIWMKMETMKICNGRTWQSMKGRWEKYVSKDLNKFNVTAEDLIEADKRIYGDDGATEETDDRSNFRGVRSGRSFYTREEDLKILNFLLQNRRYQDVKGRAVWQVNLF